ncbi:MAG: YbgC/FadM family acyl-CoA thioesterase [Pseudomonadota bacterium]
MEPATYPSDYSPGRFRGPRFEMPIRIHYADTDAGGVVYHAQYLAMGERCRAEMLRVLGAPLVGPDGDGFVVRKAGINWLHPARLDDLLICTTEITGLGGASLTMRHHFDRDGEAIAEIDLVLVHVSAEGRPQRLAEDTRTLFARCLVAP